MKHYTSSKVEEILGKLLNDPRLPNVSGLMADFHNNITNLLSREQNGWLKIGWLIIRAYKVLFAMELQEQEAEIAKLEKEIARLSEIKSMQKNTMNNKMPVFEIISRVLKKANVGVEDDPDYRRGLEST